MSSGLSRSQTHRLGAALAKVDEFGLVDAAASEDFDGCEAALIQDAPNAFGKLDEIAAVEPDRAN